MVHQQELWFTSTRIPTKEFQVKVKNSDDHQMEQNLKFYSIRTCQIGRLPPKKNKNLGASNGTINVIFTSSVIFCKSQSRRFHGNKTFEPSHWE
jgi:hypothetical protein